MPWGPLCFLRRHFCTSKMPSHGSPCEPGASLCLSAGFGSLSPAGNLGARLVFEKGSLEEAIKKIVPTCRGFVAAVATDPLGWVHEHKLLQDCK